MLIADEIEKVTHVVMGQRESGDFTINDSPEFFEILSKALYSDERRATVREPLCNAWDAHIRAGKTDTPITVTVMNNTLTIRDYGSGIAHELIPTIYCQYGNSDKRNENSTETGGFGLGSKAPLAYTDTFTVVSHHEGTKRWYVISKNSATGSGRPEWHMLGKCPTEESGLEVSIPLKEGESNKFIELVRSIATLGGIYVSLNNEAITPVLPVENSCVVLGKNGVLRSMAGTNKWDSTYIRYGSVVYLLDTSADTRLADAAVGLHKLFSTARFPAGSEVLPLLVAEPSSLAITPSRETLKYTPNTVEALIALLESATLELAQIKRKYLLKLKERVQAKVFDPSINTLEGVNFDSKLVGYAEIGAWAVTPEEIGQTLSSYPYRDICSVLNINQPRLLIKAAQINKRAPASKLAILSWMVRKEQSDATAWRKLVQPIIRKLLRNQVDLDALRIIDANQSYRGDKVDVYSWRSRDFYRYECKWEHCIALLKPTVILSTRVSTFSSLFLDRKDRVYGAFMYYVKDPKDAQEVYEKFVKAGFTVIDWCGAKTTAEVEKAELRKALPPAERKKKAAGFIPLKEVSSRTWRSNPDARSIKNYEGDMITDPEFIMHLPVSAGENVPSFLPSRGRYIDFVTCFGKVGGVTQTKPQYEKAIKMGIPDVVTFLNAKALEVFQRQHVKDFFLFAAIEDNYSQPIRSFLQLTSVIPQLAHIGNETWFNEPILTEEESFFVDTFQAYCWGGGQTRRYRNEFSDATWDVFFGVRNPELPRIPEEVINFFEKNPMSGIVDFNVVEELLFNPNLPQNSKDMICSFIFNLVQGYASWPQSVSQPLCLTHDD